MTPIPLLALFAAAIFGLGAGSPATADDFPHKPIRAVVPFTPGSATDILGRLIGTKILDSWGQNFVVDNRPSAGGIVAGTIVSQATPDGYTLLLTSSAFAGSAALYAKLPYDSEKDFMGITQVTSTPVILVVGHTLSVKSAEELIKLARSKPGKVNFASSGVGSGTHYAGEYFKQFAKINVVHVPYRGSPEALHDTVAGRTEYYLAPVLTAMPLIKGGRVLALATTGTERLPMLPDVPTLTESALPGFVYDGWFGLLAPKGTPRSVIDALSKEVGRILRLPDVSARIRSSGAVPKPSTPAQIEKLIREEIVTRRKVFQAAGVKPR